MGDRDLAPQASQRVLFSRTVRRQRPFGNERVDRGIDPADEEARDARNARQIAAAGSALLEPCDIRLDHLFVRLVGEQERCIDVDAFASQGPDRRKTRRRRGDLDHEVLAPHGPPQPPRFVERARGVVCEKG